MIVAKPQIGPVSLKDSEISAEMKKLVESEERALLQVPFSR